MDQPVALSRPERPTKDPFSRVLAYLRWLPHRKTLTEGVAVPSSIADVYDRLRPSLSEIYQPPPVDPSAPCEHLAGLMPHLQSLLPDGCEWLERGALERGALEFVGDHPVDAGGFADVWVGAMGSRRVAIKSYRRYSSSDNLLAYARFYKEALVYGCLRGWSGVVPFIGVYSTPEHPSALVFEFMDHLNLREYLRNNRDVGRLELLLEIARSVESMHKVDVVHGNIKITNILIDSGGHARIAGLGTALLPPAVPEVEINRFFSGAAPELIDSQPFGSPGAGATKVSDAYAFAVLSWEVFAGKSPFSDEGGVAAVFSMLNGRQPARPNHPELSDRLWKAIRGCWKVDPTRRKTVTEIVAVLEAEMTARRSRPRLLYQNRT